MAVKNHMTAMATVFLSLFLLTLAGMILAPFVPMAVEELFGAQGGEMVQLQTSHVPTLLDTQEMEEERRQVKREIVDMTGYW
jgi:hypothetical protein